MTVKDITVIEKATFTQECQVALDGKMQVAGGIRIEGGGVDGYDLWTNGETYIGGKCVMGTNNSSGHNLVVYGSSELNGYIDLKGQLKVNGKETLGYGSETTIVVDVPFAWGKAYMKFNNGL